MSHLFSFRQGWQSENIAKFILSKFSFVAEPSTVSDDIGSDFICTLFRIKNKKYLLPQNSFEIQIKSKKDITKLKDLIDITKHAAHLFNREIPFYIGVVDKEKLKMKIYSGEALQHFVTHIGGVPEGCKAYIKLFDSLPDRNDLYELVRNKSKLTKVYLKFPKVIEIGYDFNYQENPYLLDVFFSVCRMIQKNIASKISAEYIYNIFGSDNVRIYAGPDSVKTFRDNFLRRLLEVFENLNWMLDNKSGFTNEEYDSYKKIHSILSDLYRDKMPTPMAMRISQIDEKLSKKDFQFA